jgi:TetR/AcrR family transcriptional regulator
MVASAQSRRSAARKAATRGQWNLLVPTASKLRDLKIEALYRQAARSFHRNGYAGTSLADIADQLGVSKAALYHYIGNKQELLLRCHLAAADAANYAIAQVPERGLNGREKVRLALRLYLDSILSDTSASVIALEVSALTPENFRMVVAKRDAFQNAFVRFIREGIKDGSIVRCDPKLATFAVLGGVNWVEKWYRPTGPWSRLQITQAMADMMVRAISSEPRRGFPESISDYPEILAAEVPPPASAFSPRKRARRA